MANMIHYEEDIFFLKEMIKTLRRGYSIKIDQFIFLEYSINQLLFISTSLKKLYSSINESNHIKLPEQVRNLIRLSSSFRDLLDDLINERLKSSEYGRNYITKLKSLDHEHRRESAELKELLLQISENEDNEELVSEEEFLFLLQDNE